MEKVLIVDDEKEALEAIKDCLSDQYDVETAFSGQDAIKKALSINPDVIVLDYKLPDLSGADVCKILHENDKTKMIPILFVSGMNGCDCQSKAFDAGADDYIKKPFTSEELAFRIRARINKSKQNNGIHLTAANLKIDLRSSKVFVDSDEISLTPKEFKLLALFVQNKNSVVDRDKAIHTIWGETKVSPRNVDSQINNLRKKISSFSGSIDPVPGVGYKLKV